MTHPVLGTQLQEKFERIKQLLERSVALAGAEGDPELQATLRDRLAAVQAAALFVVVGEVKSGKSSFVNALLRQEACEVAPDPCTAGIQEIVFGPERTVTALGEHWERLTMPLEVLREVSIVDTPGTNSIVRDHQALTERYIPQSDLVIFVFPAKNPHTASAWELLSFIRQEWHRKTVFILQQADLASEQELAVNTERVQQYARERGAQNPVVFALSAKLEKEGNPGSGYEAFREFLSVTVQNGEVWQLKLEGSRDTVRRVAQRTLARLHAAEALLSADKAFLDSLRFRLHSRQEKARSLQRLAVDSLCLTYDRLARELTGDFRAGLSISTVLRRAIPFLRDRDVRGWLDELKRNFEDAARKEIEQEATRVSKDLCEEMEAMFRELSQNIESHQSRILDRELPEGGDRVAIFENLKQQIEKLRISDIISAQSLAGTQLGDLTLAGGGIAAMGGVIAVATKIAIFDITGGILAAAGVLLVAATLLWKRRGIISDFERKIQESRALFRERIDGEIGRLFERLFLELEHRVSAPLKEIDERTTALAPRLAECAEIKALAEHL